MSVLVFKIEVHHESKGGVSLDTEERSWSLLKLAEASGVLIELADVGSLPEEYEGQARSLGYDMARIGELLLASS
jgi:hypothetical protein